MPLALIGANLVCLQKQVSVASAQIQSNGTLANWVHAGNLPIETGYLELASINGYVYSLGGIDNAGGWLTSVNRAGILAGGKLGVFTQVSGFATARGHFQTPTHNNRLYAVGGYRFDAIYYDEVLVTSPQSIPRTGSFTRRYDFDAGVKPTKLITRGTKQDGAVVSITQQSNAACGATAYDNTQTISDTDYNGANAQNINIGTTRSLARCMTIRYTIDDTMSAVFPDEGNESTITDFDLYFDTIAYNHV